MMIRVLIAALICSWELLMVISMIQAHHQGQDTSVVALLYLAILPIAAVEVVRR